MPVDAVITWVDGHDKRHQLKLKQYLNQKKIQNLPFGARPTRFNQCDEISFCIKSILIFAPWIRTIFIVTDEQVPEIFNELKNTEYGKKIKLVSHHEIFCGYEQYLPTFNSLSIETMLRKIKGLADHFIYFNDDVSLVRPVTYQDFFEQDKIIIRGKWKTQFDKKVKISIKKNLARYFNLTIPKNNEHRQLQENSARVAGFKKHFFHLPHHPFPLKKQSFLHFFNQFPALLEHNISYAIRSMEQFWPISLIKHIEIQNQRAILSFNDYAIMINGEMHSEKKIEYKLGVITQDKQIKYLCLQSLDHANETTKQMIVNWLEKQIQF